VIVYRPTDKISYSLGEIKFSISPLTFHQKQQVASLLQEAVQNKNPKKMLEASILTVKMALKSIHGLKFQDGSDFKLEFDENGLISDESIDVLLNTELSEKLIGLCSQLVNGIPKELPEGVVIEKKS
jgi:hypothetical protein